MSGPMAEVRNREYPDGLTSRKNPEQVLWVMPLEPSPVPPPKGISRGACFPPLRGFDRWANSTRAACVVECTSTGPCGHNPPSPGSRFARPGAQRLRREASRWQANTRRPHTRSGHSERRQAGCGPARPAAMLGLCGRSKRFPRNFCACMSRPSERTGRTRNMKSFCNCTSIRPSDRGD